MAGRSQREIKTLHDHVFRFVAYAGAGAVVLFFLLGHRLLLLAYGPAFADADLLVDILVVEAAISCLAHAAMQLFLSLDRPGYVSTTHFVWFVAVVVGLILLVPHYGSAGAATAMLVAAVSRLTALLFGIKAQLRLGLPRLHPIRSDLVYLRSQLAG
jgi:O-antigen/teichoic acid export membrane protein